MKNTLSHIVLFFILSMFLIGCSTPKNTSNTEGINTTPPPRVNPAATRIYDQGGDFTTNTANKGGVSADSLNNTFGRIAVGSSGVFIADTNNNRVLIY